MPGVPGVVPSKKEVIDLERGYQLASELHKLTSLRPTR
jgi:hypothetical protein